eukprot:TRINITY_DN8959_c0_g1_i1.p1 TRINITY_DN8959_c0_g1~~TRINITY_DN8959_c0_g1_i1.p1  ORF type:complete len:186 (+),score=41.60 TRINITY_DN8959_c0_g1_i1:13-570(+)
MGHNQTKIINNVDPNTFITIHPSLLNANVQTNFTFDNYQNANNNTSIPIESKELLERNHNLKRENDILKYQNDILNQDMKELKEKVEILEKNSSILTRLLAENELLEANEENNIKIISDHLDSRQRKYNHDLFQKSQKCNAEGLLLNNCLKNSNISDCKQNQIQFYSCIQSTQELLDQFESLKNL